MPASHHDTTRLHNPEDLDLNHHRREILKTRKAGTGIWVEQFV
jgi:hypothetical protein